MTLPTAKYKDLQNLLQKEETNSQLDVDKDCFVKLFAELRKKRKQLMQLRSLLDNATNNNSDGCDHVERECAINADYETELQSVCELVTMAKTALEENQVCRHQYDEQQAVFTTLGLTMQSLPDAKTVDAAAVSAATSHMEEEARVAAEKRMTAYHTLAAQITTSHQLTSQLSRAEVIEKKANWYNDYSRLMHAVNGVEVKQVSQRAVLMTVHTADKNSIDLTLHYNGSKGAYESLSSVTMEPDLPGAEWLCADAVKTNDPYTLITTLQSNNVLAFLLELAQVRLLYPIDWEPASRQLRILFGNDASITCVVHVPVEYPHASVTLVHLSNAPHAFNLDLLNSVAGTSLSAWLKNAKAVLQAATSTA